MRPSGAAGASPAAQGILPFLSSASTGQPGFELAQGMNHGAATRTPSRSPRSTALAVPGGRRRRGANMIKITVARAVTVTRDGRLVTVARSSYRDAATLRLVVDSERGYWHENVT
jgi:hypothetical protein